MDRGSNLVEVVSNTTLLAQVAAGMFHRAADVRLGKRWLLVYRESFAKNRDELAD